MCEPKLQFISIPNRRGRETFPSFVFIQLFRFLSSKTNLEICKVFCYILLVNMFSFVNLCCTCIKVAYQKMILVSWYLIVHWSLEEVVHTHKHSYNTHTSIHIHIHVYTYIHSTYTHTCTYNTLTYIIHIHIYIQHPYIHTYIHTYLTKASGRNIEIYNCFPRFFLYLCISCV